MTGTSASTTQTNLSAIRKAAEGSRNDLRHLTQKIKNEKNAIPYTSLQTF